MNKARTRISPYGWVMIMLLLILGAINFADKAVLGLAIVTFGSAIGPAVFAPTLTFVIVVVGWRVAFALLGGIGLLWVILWLLVGRERPETRPMPVQETQGERPKMHWSEARPLFFSRTVIFSILAAFGAYWATALYLTWNPVYLVTVRHLRLSDPLYLAGITLPGIIAPLVTGLIIQAAGKNVAVGFHNAYLLASLLLLVFGVVFLAFARPDEQHLGEKGSIHVVLSHE